MTITTTRSIDLGDVVELIRQRADEIDRDRKLTDDVIGALRATGIYRSLLPAALGGFETPPHEVLELIETISAADGSTGWCAAIGAGSNVFAGYVNEEAAREMFADPDASNASMFAPLGNVVRTDGSDGGLALTGRWPFASNCLHASWIGLGSWFADSDDGAVDPVPRLAFVRTSDLTVHDTWNVVGLRGTGSTDVSVDGVAIDRAHSCAFSDRPWAEGPLWRMPIFTVLASVLSAVTLGIARGALDEIIRQVHVIRPSMRGNLVDDPVAMSDFASADATLRAASAGLRDAVQTVWGLASNGEPVSKALQARVFLAGHHACDTAVDVTSTAHRLGGGPAAYLSSPLLRSLTDVHTARQHALFSRQGRIMLGKAVAGLDVAAPPFIV